MGLLLLGMRYLLRYLLEPCLHSNKVMFRNKKKPNYPICLGPKNGADLKGFCFSRISCLLFCYYSCTTADDTRVSKLTLSSASLRFLEHSIVIHDKALLPTPQKRNGVQHEQEGKRVRFHLASACLF